jgi:protoporphyrinogen oxidase
MNEPEIVCIGAGPACLSAAYELSKTKDVLVLEANSEYVGGISRTVNYKNFLFDIGGHRFFSKSQEINDFWQEILGDEMLTRPRKSRIYYGGKFYSYPLKPFEALFNLGAFESLHCMASYLLRKVFPLKEPKNFQEWVSNQFGDRLFSIFFQTYTEKVWGMKCTEISADWAAQRIKGLSLWNAISSALFPQNKHNVKSLIDSFKYPRKGPGQMWSATTEKIKQNGGRVWLGRKVIKLNYLPNVKKWEVVYINPEGQEYSVLCKRVISSAPMGKLVENLTPKPTQKIIDCAKNLKYRDFLVVALMVEDKNRFDDNWLYIHDPKVKVGRIQNFKSWSPDMVPDPTKNCYGLEYFCNEGDETWKLSDNELIELAKKEITQLEIIDSAKIIDGCVVRQKKAYPVYDESYADRVAQIREYVFENYPELYLVGRNGMHKYNNQDHAMMTGLLTAENIIAGKKIYDVWCVNQDAEYHEEALKSGLRDVPQKV